MTATSSASASSVPTPATHAWLLYGANGYTGELIAREAVRRGGKPILAGRSRDKVARLARELGCETRVFDLEDQRATLIALEDVRAVLNCAGPFSRTAGRLMQACLVSHVHYLDITGEIDVFELAHSLSDKAHRAHIVLCPGVGFDVVPTDSVAAKLKASLPDATHLALAFESRGRPSVGTAKTAVEYLRSGGCVRKDGVLVREALAQRTRRIDLGEGERNAVSIPWGDVSTAYYTTGIPNIELYIATSAESVAQLRKAWRWRSLLGTRFMQWLLKRSAARGPQGPTEAERNNNPTLVWGEVVNVAGTKKVAHLRTANGYLHTVHAALGILERVLRGDTPHGFTTPALLMGTEFVESLPGSSKIRIIG
jgi:short subunit dehydrogenase-like uncharacterized protein